MPNNGQDQVKRIFYFNVNYACNNRCVFCYSHNTRQAKVHDELSLADMEKYLTRVKVNPADRVIVNGGEPFLHTEIRPMLQKLAEYGCEVLIYTNGRLLRTFPVADWPAYYRLVVPVHGSREVHDSITRCHGSFNETLHSLDYMACATKCTVDVKIIINPVMIASSRVFADCLEAYAGLSFNGAVHLTKMADTRLAVENGCRSLTQDTAAAFTEKLFEFWKQRNKNIKVFDTCVKKMDNLGIRDFTSSPQEIKVFFKDCHLEKRIATTRSLNDECALCAYKDCCFSAVEQYRTLEWCQSCFKETLE